MNLVDRIQNPSLNEINNYLKRKGKKGEMTLRIMGNDNEFIQAISSSAGLQLLEDDINRHEALLTKIYNETATPQENAEFRYLKDRLKMVVEKINRYKKMTGEVKSGQ